MTFWPGSSAVADTSVTPAVLQTAWYWQNAYEQANPPVAETPPATEPTGVPSGDLAVAYTGNQDKTPSKMTAIAFDISSVPAGATITSFTFSLTLDTAPTATSFAQQEAKIEACLPTRLWPAGEQIDYTNEPTWDCGNKAAATVNGNTYSFSIAAIAQSWITDQNLGVAIVNDPDATTAPFQLDFTGAKTIKASMTYTPPVVVPSPPPTPPPTGTGTGVGTGTTGGTVPPPINVPPVVTTNGGGGTQPVVAPSTPTTPAASPVAAIKAASALPTSGFWIAGIVLGLLMLAASFVLGDPETPVPVSSGGSKLERALRERTAEAFRPGSA